MRNVYTVALFVMILALSSCSAGCTEVRESAFSTAQPGGQSAISEPMAPGTYIDKQWDKPLSFVSTVFVKVPGRSWEANGLPADVPVYRVPAQFSLYVYPASDTMVTDPEKPWLKKPRPCWLFKVTRTSAGEFAIGTGSAKGLGGIPTFTYYSKEDQITTVATDGVLVGGTDNIPKKAVKYEASQPLELGKFYALSNPAAEDLGTQGIGVFSCPFCIFQVE